MLIAIEGPVGAGKTTLARRISKLMPGSTLILEDFGANAFLPDFYDDPARWSLHMQLDFLLSRARQFDVSVAHGLNVADHSYARDRIFSSLLLHGRELDLYERLAALLMSRVVRPNLTILLDLPVRELLRRIAARGRAMELGITEEYLAKQIACYDSYFSTVDYPVIKIDCSGSELDASNEDQNLVDEIRRRLSI